MMRLTEKTVEMTTKARNQFPIGLFENEWIELTIAAARQERPEHRQLEGKRDEHHVPDLQHPLALLDHHGVKERGGREPRHQRGVLDRIPRVVAAPADLDVRPVRAEQLADAEERPGRERESARRDEPALVRPAGQERARRRRRTGSTGRRSRGTASADGSPCTGSGGSASGRRRRPAQSACRTGWRPRRARTRRRSRSRRAPGTTQATRSRRSRRFTATAKRAVAGEDQQPQQERALLPTPERGQRVAVGEGAARVLRDVDEREVVRDERAAPAPAAATSVEPKQAKSAFRAETASRRRLVRAATKPTTSA